MSLFANKRNQMSLLSFFGALLLGCCQSAPYFLYIYCGPYLRKSQYSNGVTDRWYSHCNTEGVSRKDLKPDSGCCLLQRKELFLYLGWRLSLSFRRSAAVWFSAPHLVFILPVEVQFMNRLEFFPEFVCDIDK